MARHPAAVAWEQKLKAIFDRIDDHLEDRYGHLYPLHPARARRDATCNKEHDGLFNIGASFSPGFDSEHGAGYLVDVHLSTLANVPQDVRARIEDEVAQLLRRELPKAFPGRQLSVERDGSTYKIYGDLSLGKL